jgi:hypothetical protein
MERAASSASVLPVCRTTRARIADGSNCIVTAVRALCFDERVGLHPFCPVCIILRISDSYSSWKLLLTEGQMYKAWEPSSICGAVSKVREHQEGRVLI